MLGAQRLVERGLVRADWGLALEPTDLAIVYTHKGAEWLRLTAHGRAAHGSHPDRGVNAVTGMARVIQSLEQRRRELQQRAAASGARPADAELGGHPGRHGGEHRA